MAPRSREFDRVFHALAHPTRRTLMDLLHEEPAQTLSELCAGQDASRQAITKHLEVLEEADLVISRWVGREKLHFLNPVPLSEAYDAWIARYVTREAKALVGLRNQIEQALAARRARRA